MLRLSTLALLALSVPALAQEINVYSHRQPELIQPLVDAFTKETGIAVNVAFVDKGMAERLQAEGAGKAEHHGRAGALAVVRGWPATTPFLPLRQRATAGFPGSCKPASQLRRR